MLMKIFNTQSQVTQNEAVARMPFSRIIHMKAYDFNMC